MSREAKNVGAFEKFEVPSELLEMADNFVENLPEKEDEILKVEPLEIRRMLVRQYFNVDFVNGKLVALDDNAERILAVLCKGNETDRENFDILVDIAKTKMDGEDKTNLLVAKIQEESEKDFTNLQRMVVYNYYGARCDDGVLTCTSERGKEILSKIDDNLSVEEKFRILLNTLRRELTEKLGKDGVIGQNFKSGETSYIRVGDI